MRGPETKLRVKIQEAIKEEYGLDARTIKIHGNAYQEAGISDLLMCIRGVFFAFEVKTPGNVAEPIQVVFMAEVRRAGGIAATVYSVQQALVEIKQGLARGGYFKMNRRRARSR